MPADDPTELPPGDRSAPASETELAPSGVRPLLSRGLVRAGIVTYLFSGLTLVANLITGIVTARALGPDGRGVTVALLTVAQLATVLFAAGATQSLSYYVARRPADAPSLLTTWGLLLVPLAAVGIGVGEALLPTIFADGGDEAVSAGRWFLLTVLLGIGLEVTFGLLLGIHDFFVYNALRFAQPMLLAAGLLALWGLDLLTVESGLAAAAATAGIVLAAGVARAIERIGVGSLDPRLGLATLWYGIRGQGAAVAPNVTARLDVAMLPAFTTAANVGLYSVATNISLIVYQLSNTFAGLVLPAAARDGDRGRLKVLGSLWASLAVAGVIALALAVFGRPLLGFVYGDEFRDAAEPLLLLLPGAVLFAGSTIISAGVYAEGRPFTATVAQLIGMLVTIVGLFAFLRSGGITAAALVSTAAYSTVFLATLVAYKTVSGTPWRSFLPTPARLRALAR